MVQKKKVFTSTKVGLKVNAQLVETSGNFLRVWESSMSFPSRTSEGQYGIDSHSGRSVCRRNGLVCSYYDFWVLVWQTRSIPINELSFEWREREGSDNTGFGTSDFKSFPFVERWTKRRGYWIDVNIPNTLNCRCKREDTRLKDKEVW